MWGQDEAAIGKEGKRKSKKGKSAETEMIKIGSFDATPSSSSARGAKAVDAKGPLDKSKGDSAKQPSGRTWRRSGFVAAALVALVVIVVVVVAPIGGGDGDGSSEGDVAEGTVPSSAPTPATTPPVSPTMTPSASVSPAMTSSASVSPAMTSSPSVSIGASPSVSPSPSATPADVIAVGSEVELSGVSAEDFDEDAQDAFSDSVAVALGVASTSVVITDYGETDGGVKKANTQVEKAVHKSGSLQVSFDVLVAMEVTSEVSDDGDVDGQTIALPDDALDILATMQNVTSFLNDIVNELATGPLSFANLVRESFAPPTVEDSVSQCPMGTSPIIRSYPAEVAPGPVRLLRSQKDKLLLLKVDSGPLAPWVARSFEGGDWQTLAGVPIDVPCCKRWCAANLPPLLTDTMYVLSSAPEAEVQAVAPFASDRSLSRFLTQATFGPTRATLAALRSMLNESDPEPRRREAQALRNWVADQISQPPTLHRAYFRQRSNVRVPLGASSPLGAPRPACSVGARFHRYTFVDLDRGKVITPTYIDATDSYTLHMDGEVRTEVAASVWTEAVSNESATSNFVICFAEEWVGGTVWLAEEGVLECSSRGQQGSVYSPHNNPEKTLPNPSLLFSSPHPAFVSSLTIGTDLTWNDLATYWTPSDVKIVDAVEQSLSCPYTLRVVHDTVTGDFFRYDVRFGTLDNTLSAPADTNASTTLHNSCPNVPKTFVNAHTCVKRPSCAPLEYQSADIELSRTNLRSMYDVSGKLIYVVSSGLLLEGGGEYTESPCVEGHGRSRWAIGSCSGGTSVGVSDATQAAVLAAIASAGDTNPHVVDVDLAAFVLADANYSCTASELVPGGGEQGKSIVDPDTGVCYTHVHRDHLSVFDFTYWGTQVHPGNREASNYLPIVSYIAGEGGVDIAFPSSDAIADTYGEEGFAPVELGYVPAHSMNSWLQQVNNLNIQYMGRLDDVVDFADLPDVTQDLAIADLFGAVSVGRDSEAVEACGSAGEVASVPELDHKYSTKLAYVHHGYSGVYSRFYANYNKHAIQGTINLFADDQLRQRVAWALSQTFVISTETGLENRAGHTEIWPTFYDIFVRHAFGSYLDVMKEVAYSPMMGQVLTYRDNKAYHVNGNPPDENFARELMQLFTIGLFKLNRDGTQELDTWGEPQPTFTTTNVMDFARTWTGFTRQSFRANIEAHRGWGSTNDLDPMRINSEWRDKFPKTGLENSYIGDGVPPCVDMPERMWLLPGARYTLIGKEEGVVLPRPRYFSVMPPWNNPAWGQPEDADREFIPDASSELYALLCNRPEGTDADGMPLPCDWAIDVTLTERLQCTGLECDVESPRMIKILDNQTAEADRSWRWYEFVPPKCVRFPYFSDAKVIAKYNNHGYMCADPRDFAAGTSCCRTEQSPLAHGKEYCNFWQEMVTFAKAEERCQVTVPADTDWMTRTTWTGKDLTVCPDTSRGTHSSMTAPSANRGMGCGHGWQHTWRRTNCTLQAQVNSFGKINVVHSGFLVESDADVRNGATQSGFAVDNGNIFSVHWSGGVFPTLEDGCGLCTSHKNETCLCNVEEVDDAPVLVNPLRTVRAARVVASLHIGAPDVSLFAPGTYSRCYTAACNRSAPDVEIYVRQGEAFENTSTIFKVFKPTRFFFNRQSTVRLSGGFAFRNPPNLINQAEPSVIQAEYETDVVLRSLFEHQNTPPFVAHRLIQRMVTSNPSPAYVKKVADAFASGSHDGVVYGGDYGDLGAAVAATLLSDEARATILDADPTSGQLREPYLKVFHFLRSNEYDPVGDKELVMPYMADAIGQQVFSAPSVFNFFLPDYQPLGPIRVAGLSSPESMLATAPLVLGFLNGMNSLVTWGLSRDDDGWGHPWAVTGLVRSGGNNDGELTFVPTNASDAASVVNELDVLLTAGRLANRTRRVFEDAYASVLASTSSAVEAVKRLQKLFLVSAEFSTFGSNILTEAERTPDSEVPSQNRTYKAVVVLFQWGGVDSWNLLVPHSGCSGDVDLYEEYKQIRGPSALNKPAGCNDLDADSCDLLDARSSAQPCDAFFVHPRLPYLAQLYKEGDAVFLANTGSLVEPVTKQEYLDGTKRVPKSLFAHNVQQSATQQVHAGQSKKPKGILGRLIEALRQQSPPYRTGAYSLAGVNDIMDGHYPATIVHHSKGVETLNDRDELLEDIEMLTERTSASPFVETHYDILNRTIVETEKLSEPMAAINTEVSFSTDRVGNSLKQIAKIIKMRSQTSNEREVFFANQFGYDTHFNTHTTVNAKFHEINQGLESFVEEMKRQGTWEDVVIVSASDFGRTLQNNGQGTDHAWGGNYFVAGGGLKGGKIHGIYPSRLDETHSDVNVAQGGRMVPTMPWEGLWFGIAQWFGVLSAQLPDVLPNGPNFPGSVFLTQDDLFEEQQ